jgi:hypothetical protein
MLVIPRESPRELIVVDEECVEMAITGVQDF